MLRWLQSSQELLCLVCNSLSTLCDMLTWDVIGLLLFKDLDECFLDDWWADWWAYCINNFGCWSGYIDLNPSRPGHSCAGTVEKASVEISLHCHTTLSESKTEVMFFFSLFFMRLKIKNSSIIKLNKLCLCTVVCSMIT